MLAGLSRFIAVGAFLGLSLGHVVAAEPAPALGSKIADFSLKDSAGKAWRLSDAKDSKAVVVLFLGTECPINNAYLPRLAEMSKAYASKGVQFIAINANTQDTAQRVAEHVKKNAIPFPVLKDTGNVVADQFAAERTPEAFVLDGERHVRYRGRIDDQFGIGYQRNKPTRNDLAEALDEVLAGKKVSVPTAPVMGCIIGRVMKPKTDGAVTYAKQVSRIIQNKCQECHRPDQIGPMALLTYDDVISWSKMIHEVVETKRMPPWLADPKHGKFSNDRSLSQEERATLLAWIDGGCPKGDDKDLPPACEYASSYRISKPDAILSMPQEAKIPATAPKSGVPYQYYVVPTNFKEDVWVQAAEARPGNAGVVHHIIVSVKKPGLFGRNRGADGIGEGMLAVYAPGDVPATFEPGTAKLIPKGSVLIFQMHYTPNGVEGTDRSSVALVFAKEPAKHEVKTRSIATRRISIPPGDGNYKAESASTFTDDTVITALFPHMHLRGKSFEYRVVYPDGKKETLLSVPRWDFGWQANYRLAKPLHLPAGSRIECTAFFDNGKDNPNNPDPTKTVRWGDQTWDEMMIGFVDYYVGK